MFKQLLLRRLHGGNAVLKWPASYYDPRRTLPGVGPFHFYSNNKEFFFQSSLFYIHDAIVTRYSTVLPAHVGTSSARPHNFEPRPSSCKLQASVTDTSHFQH